MLNTQCKVACTGWIRIKSDSSPQFNCVSAKTVRNQLDFAVLVEFREIRAPAWSPSQAEGAVTKCRSAMGQDTFWKLEQTSDFRDQDKTPHVVFQTLGKSRQ